MRINLPIIFSQFDPAYKDKLIGFNTDPKYNFYNYGCTLSDIAMIARYFGKEDSPASINDKVIAVAGFVPGSGLYIHGSITKIYPDIGERVTKTPDLLTDAQMQEIKTALDGGQPVMVRIDYNPKTIERENHFVILVDYNPNDENDFTVVDSLGGTKHSIKSYLGFLKPSIRNSIEEYFIYSGFPAVAKVEPGAAAVRPVEEQPIVVPTTPVDGASQPGVAAVLPANYPDIIHGSTEWDSTVGYLELGKLPKDATFEDVKRKVAGFKSTVTDYNNKRIEAEKEAAKNEVVIKNQKEDIGRLQAQVATEQKLHRAEIDSLKQNAPSYDNYKKQVEGVIAESQGKLTEVIEELKQARIDLAHKEVEDRVVKEQVEGERAAESVTPTAKPKSFVETIRYFVKRVIVIK